MKFFPFPCYLVPRSSNFFLYTLFSSTLSLRSSLNVSDQVSHPHKTTGKIIVLYILIFKFLVTRSGCNSCSQRTTAKVNCKLVS